MISWFKRRQKQVAVVDVREEFGPRLSLEELRSEIVGAQSRRWFQAIGQLVAAHRAACSLAAANKGNHVNPGEAAFECGGVAVCNDLLMTLAALERGEMEKDALILHHFPPLQRKAED